MPKATSSKPTGAAPMRVASSTSSSATAAATKAEIAVVGIDIGKYTFHIVALDRRGRVVLRIKLSRSRKHPVSTAGAAVFRLPG